MNATLVLTNGNIHTMDPNRPVAQAVAIRDNEIIAVGDNADMKALLGPGGETVDLGGRTATPGLVDAHVHYSYFAIGLAQVDLIQVDTRSEAEAMIRDKVAELQPGQWLDGRGWTVAMWDERFPTIAELDALCPNNPALLRDKSGHAAWANSLAMKIANVTRGSEPPAGGDFQRDADGHPTGIFFETAIDMVRNHIPTFTPAELQSAMERAQPKCWEVGLTGIHDFDGRECFQALQAMRQNGTLGMRFVKNIPNMLIDEAVGVGLQSGFGDEWLRIGGIKMFADGALGPRTALMLAPYEGETDNIGIAVLDKEEMHAIASKASANGLSVTVHAIGDRANHDILDVYESVRQEEAARGESPHRLRHRIEHVQILHPDDIGRLAQLNVIASMQPLHATSDMLVADELWGARARYSYAWRSLLNTGATLVYGSDCPVEPIDPMLGIYASVARNRPDGTGGENGWYPEEKLTLEETIHGFTMGAAVTSSQEATQGSITSGKLADITIFDRDIYGISNAELAESKVSATIVGGEFKYRQL